MKVVRDEEIQILLFFRGNEFLSVGFAFGIIDVFKNLSPQGTLTKKPEPLLKVIKIVFCGQPRELGTKAF